MTSHVPPAGLGQVDGAEPRPAPRGGRRRGAVWTALAVVELAVAAAVVVLDIGVPSLVILALAGLSLLVRGEPLSTLGFHRMPRAGRRLLVVAALAVAWTALSLALVMPLAERATGQRQDVSQYADLEGDLPRLLLLLGLSWTLAAVGEELAFRGFVLTRVTDVIGTSALGAGVAVVATGGLFALIHTEQGAVGMLLAFVDAVFYGALRFRFHSLWAPVVAHGVINTLGMVAFFLVGPVHALW